MPDEAEKFVKAWMTEKDIPVYDDDSFEELLERIYDEGVAFGTTVALESGGPG